VVGCCQLQCSNLRLLQCHYTTNNSRFGPSTKNCVHGFITHLIRSLAANRRGGGAPEEQQRCWWGGRRGVARWCLGSVAINIWEEQWRGNALLVVYCNNGVMLLTNDSPAALAGRLQCRAGGGSWCCSV